MAKLKTGFTGELDDKDSVGAKARQASRYVKREAGAVVATAQDHPSATGGAFLLFGAVAFVAGFLLGRGREQHGIFERFR